MEKFHEILDEIACKKGVRILYACETGSRAWGFPSPDSDYDIRFIYMHKRDWYLSLSQKKDTIEQLDGDLDITGWDLRKSLVLLKKSNAPLIERFQSPISYFAEPVFRKEFLELIQQYYSPTAVFFHHYSLAYKFWEDLKDCEEVKLKNYFYLLRSLLSCNWIISDESVLPMHIEGLMTKIDENLKIEIRALINLKATVGEHYRHAKIDNLNNWVKELFLELEKAKHSLSINKSDNHALNEYFVKMVNAYADN